MKRRTIKVDTLARVEGEGAMQVRIRGDRVEDVKLKIFEPPRFFEALLRGRDYSEAHDITARVCGICPVAYQMSAVHAMEAALGVRVDGPLRALRRLMYCGEWIESHVLHIYMLHAPDFLGYPGAVQMSKDHPDIVRRGLRLKKVGNAIVALLGGREVHPINVRVGGFYRVPRRQELDGLVEDLLWGREAAAEGVRWAAGLKFPDFEKDYELVALRHEHEYPMCEGRIVSSRGLDIAPDQFERAVEEIHVAHSNALHAVLRGRGAYLVGPMARYNLNADQLPPSVVDLAREVELEHPVRNPFRSIVVRSLEVFYAFEEALRIIDVYAEPPEPHVAVEPAAGEGHGCTEAPRGILYHRYRLDPKGTIREARIVPPTSQNQKTIEDDLYHYVQRHIALPDDELQWQCEQAIRNYDPCISCATHFLKLEVDRA